MRSLQLPKFCLPFHRRFKHKLQKLACCHRMGQVQWTTCRHIRTLLKVRRGHTNLLRVGRAAVRKPPTLLLVQTL